MTLQAVQVENIGKRYQLGLREKRHQTFREAFVELAMSPIRRLKHLAGHSQEDDTFWALREITFDVPEGQALGIIGHNGAGKSTLLKILSRITEPTEGRAVVNGRVASLLEVGTGFHQELSGRENVYLNGAILGMSREEIRRKFDAIVDFAGVEKFLDTPIKRYSSGMKVRLAFAVAAHLEPEILVIDEVLAVGDAEFQAKCLGKMNDVASGGRTVLFVSHNMAAIENLCDRAVVLAQGSVIHEGTASEAVALYHRQHSQLVTEDLRNAHRGKGLKPIIHGVDIRMVGGVSPSSTVTAGSSVEIDIHYESPEPLDEADFGLAFESHSGASLFCIHSRQQAELTREMPQQGIITCRIDRLPLLPGSYFITPLCGLRKKVVDRIPRGVQLTVLDHDLFGTGFVLPSKYGATFVEADWEIPITAAAVSPENDPFSS